MEKSKSGKKLTKKSSSQNSSGIDSEQIVLNKFANWQTDEYAQRTLLKMGYDLNRIKNVIAYIDEDSEGNRKVKLRVNLKPISTTQATTSSLWEQLKDKVSSNEKTKKILDKGIELKDKIIDKFKK